MSEEKTSTDPQQAKTASEEQPGSTMPFPEMMAKMMARCGCHPEQMGKWAICCETSHEKKQDKTSA